MKTTKKTVLVLDCGTQSVRASIIDSDGNILKIIKSKYGEPYFSINPGWCEQYPDYYLDKIFECTKKLRSEEPELMDNVSAMTITCFRDSAALLDENFNVVRPTILWLDQRKARLDEKLSFIQKAAFFIVGMSDTIKYNRQRTAAHWIKENEPENWKKIKYYVPLTTYFNLKLTGEFKESSSNCTGHYPLNYRKGKWYGNHALKGSIFGIKKSQLPPLIKPGRVLGFITPEIAEATGIKSGLPLMASGSDKSCESLGNGCLDLDELSISYGTACTIEVTSKKYHEPETFLPGYIACYQGAYNLDVQVYRGYWMLTWFAKEFAPEAIDEAAIEHMSVEEIMNKKLLEIKPGSEGLITQPYWGPGLKRPLVKGSVIGFNDYHTKYHLYRSIIEGIAFELRNGYDSIRKRTKKKPSYVVISGGGAASDAICQITADIFGVEARKVQTTETSSLGAAMSLFIALGEYKTPREAKEHMIRYVKKYTPIKENVEEYNKLYKNVYKKIYPRLSKVYRYLSNYTAK